MPDSGVRLGVFDQQGGYFGALPGQRIAAQRVGQLSAQLVIERRPAVYGPDLGLGHGWGW